MATTVFRPPCVTFRRAIGGVGIPTGRDSAELLIPVLVSFRVWRASDAIPLRVRERIALRIPNPGFRNCKSSISRPHIHSEFGIRYPESILSHPLSRRDDR